MIALPVRGALLNDTVGVADAARLLFAPTDCLTAEAPVSVIPVTCCTEIQAPVAESPVQSNVTVIADGELGVSWFDTKQTSSLADDAPKFTMTRVNVIPLALAVSEGVDSTVPDAYTQTNSSALPVGVNDEDAYVDVLLVDVVLLALDTASAISGSPQ